MYTAKKYLPFKLSVATAQNPNRDAELFMLFIKHTYLEKGQKYLSSNHKF